MSIRLSECGIHYPVINVLKSVMFLFVAHLLLNLLLAGVFSEPRVSATVLQSDSRNDNDQHFVNIEKRAPRQYSFGLGKRSNIDAVEDEDSFDEDNNEEAADETKRADQNRFSFGLGKRAGEQRFSFGLGKKAEPSRFAFGLGKRVSDSRFQFGLGKRPNDNRFSFGLGKRHEFEDYIKRRYGFGLGKRSPQDLQQRYYFGLGR